MIHTEIISNPNFAKTGREHYKKRRHKFAFSKIGEKMIRLLGEHLFDEADIKRIQMEWKLGARDNDFHNLMW